MIAPAAPLFRLYIAQFIGHQMDVHEDYTAPRTATASLLSWK